MIWPSKWASRCDPLALNARRSVSPTALANRINSFVRRPMSVGGRAAFLFLAIAPFPFFLSSGELSLLPNHFAMRAAAKQSAQTVFGFDPEAARKGLGGPAARRGTVPPWHGRWQLRARPRALGAAATIGRRDASGECLPSVPVRRRLVGRPAVRSFVRSPSRIRASPHWLAGERAGRSGERRSVRPWHGIEQGTAHGRFPVYQ
jgi:hypothetical protein